VCRHLYFVNRESEVSKQTRQDKTNKDVKTRHDRTNQGKAKQRQGTTTPKQDNTLIQVHDVNKTRQDKKRPREDKT
jgi:hypothetical protein